MTILVKSPVPRAEQPAVAAALMDYEGVYAEQAGFIEPPSLPGARALLQMAGGEFCGNAAMSLAAYLAREEGIFEGEIPIEVSGAHEVVSCRVRLSGGPYLCALSMPLPLAREDACGFPAIRLPGIVHAIVENRDVDAPALARKIADETGEDAAGVLLFSRENMEIRPLVYVRSAETLVWERGCGSGTAAVGAYLALERGGDARVDIRQPGGVIGVRAECRDGKIASLAIEGRVRIVAEGIAYA
jgi:diaminopimelate epimerase